MKKMKQTTGKNHNRRRQQRRHWGRNKLLAITKRTSRHKFNESKKKTNHSFKRILVKCWVYAKKELINGPAIALVSIEQEKKEPKSALLGMTQIRRRFTESVQKHQTLYDCCMIVSRFSFFFPGFFFSLSLAFPYRGDTPVSLFLISVNAYNEVNMWQFTGKMQPSIDRSVTTKTKINK